MQKYTLKKKTKKENLTLCLLFFRSKTNSKNNIKINPQMIREIKRPIATFSESRSFLIPGRGGIGPDRVSWFPLT